MTLISDVLAPELRENKCLLFKVTQYVVFCDSNPKKSILDLNREGGAVSEQAYRQTSNTSHAHAPRVQLFLCILNKKTCYYVGWSGSSRFVQAIPLWLTFWA